MQAITTYLALGCYTIHYEASEVWLSLLDFIHGWATPGKKPIYILGMIWDRNG